MKTVIVQNGQSVFDIAIQKCGVIDAAYDIAILNGISITDTLIGGTVLQIPAVVNKDVVNTFTLGNIEPATAMTTEQYNNTIRGEGIDFWAVEIDFVVN